MSSFESQAEDPTPRQSWTCACDLAGLPCRANPKLSVRAAKQSSGLD